MSYPHPHTERALEIIDHAIEYFQDHDLAINRGKGGASSECYYFREDREQRCAVGCLIPEDRLADEGENIQKLNSLGIRRISTSALDIHDHHQKNAMLLFNLINVDPRDDMLVGILGAMQSTHDYSNSPEDLVYRLQRLRTRVEKGEL